jgi:hypothetical protein
LLAKERILPKNTSEFSMDSQEETNILSFIVRIWKEDLSSQETQMVWRGHVTRIPDGARRYFKDLNEIPDLMMAQLKSQP